MIEIIKVLLYFTLGLILGLLSMWIATRPEPRPDEKLKNIDIREHMEVLWANKRKNPKKNVRKKKKN